MFLDRCNKKKKRRVCHLDEILLLHPPSHPLLFSAFFALKRFPGWDTSLLNGVISIKEALAHIDFNFLSVSFFSPPTG